MALKDPRDLPAHLRSGHPDSVAAEVLQEKAATLERLGGRLQKALRDLAAFEAAMPPAARTGGDARVREQLVAAAGEALWYFVIQRELLGLRDGDRVMEELDIPGEVRLRMGVLPSRRGG